MSSDIQTLLSYHNWANRLIFDLLISLTEDEWTRDLGSSFPSIQKTTAHLVGVEWVWLERFNGNQPNSAPEWMASPTAKELRNVLDDIDAKRSELLSNEKIEPGRIIKYRLFNGTEGEISTEMLVRHVVNHATYHRGQLVTMLRQVGKIPPATDFLLFLRQRFEK